MCHGRLRFLSDNHARAGQQRGRKARSTYHWRNYTAKAANHVWIHSY